MAAVLACGDGALLSHRSAAALWGIETEARGRIDVTIARHSHLRRPGIWIRTRAGLRTRAFEEQLGIPLTDPVQTLLDLATELSPGRVERAVNEADKRDLLDPDTLRAELQQHNAVPGVRLLRDLLDRHTFRLSDSDLERRFRPLARRAGLPEPLTKQRLDGFEVDFYWPHLGLVVETDGWRYHRTPAAQSRDALRFQAHAAAGRTPLRFSHRQITDDPTHVIAVLAAVARRLSPSGAAA